MDKNRGKKISIFRLIYRIIFEALFLCLLLFFGVVVGFALVYFLRTPDASDLFDRKLAQSSVIFDRTGEHVLYEIYGEEHRKSIPHDAIPDVVRLATIAAEDDSFYRHPGFDIFSMLRAFQKNLESGRIVQGGSTITQQVARIFYLNNEKTIARKLKELVLAFKIERRYTKDQILDLYLNSIPYGSNAYGIETAAERFFGKSAGDLSLDEAAFLAALPKATTYYSPYRGNDRELLLRQQGIIRRMAELRLITEVASQDALRVDTFAHVIPRHDQILAPHFVFAVLDELERRYGRAFLETGGLRVRTTLDMDLQSKAEESVSIGAARNTRLYGGENASLVAVSVGTGEVLAMAGSRDFFDAGIDGEVNVALRARQPGSAFKPFVYARAFEEGFQPETHIFDTLVDFGPDGGGREYIPKNYSGKFYGLLTMRQALSMSLNVPAVQTLNVVGVDDAIDLATRLGITTLTDPKRYGLSLVLGGAEVKPIDMASAYAVFGADGIRHEPSDIIDIRKNGKEIFSAENDPAGHRVLESDVARKIDSVLSDNVARTPVFGPRSPLAYPEGGVAAKTGTTQGFRDAWTVGFTRSIAVAVWAGNNDGRLMKAGADGVFAAAPIWRDFMDHALTRFPKEPFPAYTPSVEPDTRIVVRGQVRAFIPDDLKAPPQNEKEKNSKKKKNKKG